MNNFDLKRLHILERETRLKEREFERRAIEAERSTWKSPLVVAVLAAAVAALGNAGVTYYSSLLDREAAATEYERSIELGEVSAERERILEMIKIGDPDQVQRNLQFLMDTKLVTDNDTVASIRSYYDELGSGTGPGATVPDGEVSSRRFLPVSSFPDVHPVRTLARAVGRLKFITPLGGPQVCTAFLISNREIVTAKHCYSDRAAAVTFELFPDGYSVFAARAAPPIGILAIDIATDPLVYTSPPPPEDSGGYVVLRLSETVTDEIQPLSLDPSMGDPQTELGVIHFAGGFQQQALWGGDACRALSWEDLKVNYSCTPGPGSSGSPIFDLATNNVVAVHALRSDFGGIGYRIRER